MHLALPALLLLAGFVLALGMVVVGKAFTDALFGIIQITVKYSGVGFLAKGAGWAWKKLGGDPLDPLEAAHQWISSKLGAAADGLGGLIAESWHVLTAIVVETGQAVWDLARSVRVLHALISDAEWLGRRVVDSSAFALAIRGLKTVVRDTVHQTTTIVEQIAHPVYSPIGAAVRVVVRVDRAELARYRAWTTAHIRALEAKLAHAGAIAQPWPGTALGDLREWVAKLDKRLGKVGRQALPYIASGVFVATLARMGLGWLRCDRVKQLGRGACRSNADAMTTSSTA